MQFPTFASEQTSSSPGGWAGLSSLSISVTGPSFDQGHVGSLPPSLLTPPNAGITLFSAHLVQLQVLPTWTWEGASPM